MISTIPTINTAAIMVIRFGLIGWLSMRRDYHRTPRERQMLTLLRIVLETEASRR